MKLFENMRANTTVATFGWHAALLNRQRNAADGYDNFALKLVSGVEKGEIDPLAAEAELAGWPSTHPTGQDIYASPRAAKCSEELAKLVSIGLVDPIIAEDALNSGLSVWGTERVLDSFK